MALSAVTSHKLQLRHETLLRSYVVVAYIVVVDTQLYLNMYSFLDSLVSSIRDLSTDFMFILLWLLEFVHARDVHSL